MIYSVPDHVMPPSHSLNVICVLYFLHYHPLHHSRRNTIYNYKPSPNIRSCYFLLIHPLPRDLAILFPPFLLFVLCFEPFFRSLPLIGAVIASQPFIQGIHFHPGSQVDQSLKDKTQMSPVLYCTLRFPTTAPFETQNVPSTAHTSFLKHTSCYDMFLANFSRSSTLHLPEYYLSASLHEGNLLGRPRN